MRKKGFTFVSMVLIVIIILSSPINTLAKSKTDITKSKISILVKKAEKEIKKNGKASEKTITKLEKELKKIGISTGSYSGTHLISDNAFSTFGYGQTHNVGTGDWTYRVDRPTASEAKPHVHVDSNKNNVHGVENVDGTKSHNKTLTGAGVPNKVKEKVKNSPDYKKGKQDLENMQKAKKEIKKQKLNLSKYSDLIIAVGIFVMIVGVCFFAPEAIPGVLALI